MMLINLCLDIFLSNNKTCYGTQTQIFSPTKHPHTCHAAPPPLVWLYRLLLTCALWRYCEALEQKEKPVKLEIMAPPALAPAFYSLSWA